MRRTTACGCSCQSVQPSSRVRLGASNPAAALTDERESGVHGQGRLLDGTASDDARRDAGNGRVRRDVAQHDTAGAYLGPLADLDVAQDLGAGTDEHTAPDLRVAVAR